MKNANAPPPALKNIETVVEAGGLIKAENVEINVSRNYEWDVSLAGNAVSPQRPAGRGAYISVARGHPRASFRNLELRAYQSISFKKSGFNVVPFINIIARGRALFIQKMKDGSLKVRKAQSIIVKNGTLRFIGLEREKAGRRLGRAPAPGAPGRRLPGAKAHR